MEKGLLDNADDSRKYWHCRCGGDIYIGSNAHILCLKCGQEFSVLNSCFSCPHCTSESFLEVVQFDDSKQTTMRLPLPLTVGAELSVSLGVKWLHKFLLSLDRDLN